MIAQPVAALGLTVAAFVGGSNAPDAPTIVLLHGLGHWADGAWGRLIPRLDPAWRIVAFDLPGFGASDKPERSYDSAFFRATLAAVLDRFTTGPVVVAGHSLGAMIAADFAGEYPERVAALALFAPAGLVRAPRVVLRVLAGRFARWMFSRRPPARFVERTLRNAFYDPALLDRATIDRAVELSGERAFRRAFASVYAGAMRALMDAAGLRRQFARYHGPVLLAWGENDNYTPLRGLATARRIYPHARVLQLPRTGHALTLERPAELAAALDALLTSRPS